MLVQDHNKNPYSFKFHVKSVLFFRYWLTKNEFSCATLTTKLVSGLFGCVGISKKNPGILSYIFFLLVSTLIINLMKIIIYVSILHFRMIFASVILRVDYFVNSMLEYFFLLTYTENITDCIIQYSTTICTSRIFDCWLSCDEFDVDVFWVVHFFGRMYNLSIGVF